MQVNFTRNQWFANANAGVSSAVMSDVLYFFPVSLSAERNGSGHVHESGGVWSGIPRRPGVRLAGTQALLDGLGDQPHRGGQLGRHVAEGAVLARPGPASGHRPGPGARVSRDTCNPECTTKPLWVFFWFLFLGCFQANNSW